MPVYSIIGAKVRTYKKYFRVTAATEEKARKLAEVALDKYSPFESQAKTHVQVYSVYEVGE